MKFIDVIALLFVVIMTLIGKRTGFVKTALGTVSVLVCGVLTIFVYRFLSDAGVIATVESMFLAKIDEQTAVKLELFGVVDYIVSGLCVVLIYIGVRFLYKLLSEVLNFAVPGFLNSLLGGAFGFVKGIAVVFCVLAVIYCISGSVPEVVDKIDESGIVSVCYYNNPILKYTGLDKFFN